MAITFLNSKKTYAVYATLALLILLPILKPGFVFALDMVFTPHLRMPDSVTSSYLLHAALHILNLVVPAEVLEKLLLFAAFLGAGVGMHRLTKYAYSTLKSTEQTIGAYFSGLLYMANPFTYDRLMVGQYNVLLGYALLPFFARALLQFVRAPHIRSTAKLTAWAIAISIVSIHTLGLAILLAFVALGLYAFQRHAHRTYLQALGRWTVLGILLFVLTSSYWLIPLALGKGSTAQEISNFTTSDNRAFATLGGSAIGKFGNVIRLQGFWAENREFYVLPQERVTAWGLLMLVLWLLIIAGGAHAWRDDQRLLVGFVILSVTIAIALAVGVGNQWAAAHLPFFAGYREPQKFVALIAFGFALFGAPGAATVLRYCHAQTDSKLLTRIGAAILLVIPALLAATIWWGGNGQLSARAYPADWAAVNQQLNQDHDKFHVLFLPWHLYMHFDFAGRTIGNPASDFFDKPMIISDDPEFRGAAAVDSTYTKRRLDQILPTAERASDLGKQLATFNIKYVLLAKDSNWQTYKYLSRQPDLQLVRHGTTLDLYRNNAFGREH